MDRGTTKVVHMVAFILVVVGGLNWGLVGLLHFNVVDMVFGAGTMLSTFVYVLVGVSAIYLLGTHMNDCKICSAKKK